MSSSNSPCAACKFLRRKCTQECVFAPHFPADQPQRFANVHKAFGASNVAKILNELPKEHREDAVNSLAYEAEARLRDPVYGCVGLISILQHNLKQLQLNLEDAKKELALMVGPSAMMRMLQNPYLQAQFHPDFAAAAAAASSNPGAGGVMPFNMAQMMGTMPGGPSPRPGPGPLVIADPLQQLQPQAPQQHIGGHQLIIRDVAQQHQHQHQHSLIIRDGNLQAQQQHAFDAQQQLASVTVREEQEMMRNFEQQSTHLQAQHHHIQQQQQLMRFGGTGYHEVGASGSGSGDFIQMGAPRTATSPLLAMGGGFDGNSRQIQQQQLEQEPLLLLQQPHQSDVEAVQTIEHHQPLQVEQLFNEQPGSINEQGEAAV